MVDWIRSMVGLGSPHLTDTPAFAEFMESLSHLRDVQLLAMSATFKSIDRAEHERAWAEVRAIGQSQGLTGEIDRVRGKALAWTSKGADIVPFARTGMDDIAWSQMKHEAAEAVVDAALGVALSDRLDERTRSTLLSGWERAQEQAE